MKKTINFMLAGVGGQGTILASDVLANVGLASGYQAKQAEVHGMSQRGGSVTSYVRWGETVYSPLVGAGEVDVFLTFEKAEALRNLDQLRPGALAVISLEAIKPVTVTSGGQPYPDDDHLRLCLAQVTNRAFYVDAQKIAAGLGNLKVSNVALMGALSGLMESQDFSEPELTAETWLQVISARVPKKPIELNKKAFMAGREAVQV
jgi:indolepyruvate ferredoxin oxidoreductase, beta subunit